MISRRRHNATTTSTTTVRPTFADIGSLRQKGHRTDGEKNIEYFRGGAAAWCSQSSRRSDQQFTDIAVNDRLQTGRLSGVRIYMWRRSIKRSDSNTTGLTSTTTSRDRSGRYVTAGGADTF